jgi:hypothetical protein
MADLTHTQFSKLIERYNNKVWKHTKKWQNSYYSKEETVHSRYSDMFVLEREINLLKDVYLQSPIKEIIGQELYSLLWNFIDYYERIKDENMTGVNPFIHMNDDYRCFSGPYNTRFREIITTLYNSNEFSNIIEFMKNTKTMHKWETFKDYINNNIDRYINNNKYITENYVAVYGIDLICLKYMLDYFENKREHNYKKDIINKRSLFNSIMTKYGLPFEDCDYNSYNIWSTSNSLIINRYKKMEMFAQRYITK